ncbi:MAG: succinylglutamate desuccinylase, partial [Patescibacteria group bacterium]
DGVQKLRNLMTNLGMYRRPMFWSSAEPVYLNSRWVRTEHGGLLISKVKLGDSVVPGSTLGQVVNPINNEVYLVKAPYSGRLIGMALNQVVMPGYAAYHIGIEATEESLETTESNGTDKSGANGKVAPGVQKGIPEDVPEFE